MKKLMKLAFASTVVVAATASAASAGFVVEDVPAWRGDANTLYGGWDNFSQANNAPNFAEVGNMGGNAAIYNFSGTAFVTSSGNLYDAASALNMHHYVSVNGDITDAVFNIATMGTGINFGGVIMQWVTADGDAGYMDTSAYNTNYAQEIPGMGWMYNLSWSFDLSGIAGDVTDVAFIMGALGPHMSYDAAAIDIRLAAVPAPGAIALLGIGALANRRRRRH